MENVRNQRDVKLVTSDKRRTRLVSELNYYQHKIFLEHLMAIEMNKTKVKVTNPIYLGLSILDISERLMYESWYDYIKPKYGDRAELCYTDTGSFVIHIKTEDLFKDISADIKKWFDTSMMKMIKDLFQQVKLKNYQVFLKINQEEKLLQKLLHLDQKHGRIQWMIVVSIKKLKEQKSV